VYAPSTDACWSSEQLGIMNSIVGAAAGYTYHAYPGGNGTGPSALPLLLLNSTWLRTGIMTGSDSNTCIAQWVAGPRADGLVLWVTESSSSWSWQLPPPAQNSFLHGFYTLAALGQYASTGVGLLARWSFEEGSPFALIRYNDTRSGWDVAADYFLLVTHLATVGQGVLAVESEDPDVLVYAHCAKGPNVKPGSGAVTLLVVNPTPNSYEVSVAGAVATVPRLEYQFTANNFSDYTPILNGDSSNPLRINLNGTQPSMAPKSVTSEDTISVNPYSQSFFVLQAAGAPACL